MWLRIQSHFDTMGKFKDGMNGRLEPLASEFVMDDFYSLCHAMASVWTGWMNISNGSQMMWLSFLHDAFSFVCLTLAANREFLLWQPSHYLYWDPLLSKQILRLQIHEWVGTLHCVLTLSHSIRDWFLNRLLELVNFSITLTTFFSDPVLPLHGCRTSCEICTGQLMMRASTTATICITTIGLLYNVAIMPIKCAFNQSWCCCFCKGCFWSTAKN